MKILFDTNIVIDILEKRQPYFEDSFRALASALENNYEICVSASAVTDIYYIIRKQLKSKIDAKQAIEKLITLFSVSDVQEADIQMALRSSLDDFEDAVIAAAVKRNKVKYIITRNKKDYQNSMVPALTPDEYLKIN